jgi:hypothetical protein
MAVTYSTAVKTARMTAIKCSGEQLHIGSARLFPHILCPGNGL